MKAEMGDGNWEFVDKPTSLPPRKFSVERRLTLLQPHEKHRGHSRGLVGAAEYALLEEGEGEGKD